jgi:hypothetical protein
MATVISSDIPTVFATVLQTYCIANQAAQWPTVVSTDTSTMVPAVISTISSTD